MLDRQAVETVLEHRTGHEAEVQGAGLQVVQLRQREVVARLQFHVRVALPERLEDLRQPSGDGDVGIADHQMALLTGRGLLRLVDGAVHIGKRLRAAPQEGRPGLGQGDMAVVSVEEADADLFLDMPDRPAERRLADIQAFGGAAEMQLFGHR